MKFRIFKFRICPSVFLLVLLLSHLFFSENTIAQQPERETVQPREERRANIPPEMLERFLVTVPQLEGRAFNPEALGSSLDRIGLRLGNAIPVADNEREGMIISQNPAARQRVPMQTAVDITYGVPVSGVAPSQPEPVLVPDYSGIPVERAINRMANDRLKPGIIREIPSDQQLGNVVRHFPEHGMQVEPGTGIDLMVSQGPPPEEIRVRVPLLIGYSLQEAAEILRAAGLYAGQLREQLSGEREGVIIGQDPPVNSLVPAGSIVDITFSVRDEFAEVPDVTHFPLEKAVMILNESRLNHSVEYRIRSNQPLHTVLEQDPLPGTRVPFGFQVHLVVAKSEKVPPWIYWAGGILAAILLGGLAGLKMGRNTNSPDSKRVTLKPVPDSGKQSVNATGDEPAQGPLTLKIIPDKGIQTIKNG